MGMHFKLGLYEHQSAGALEGAINALVNNPELVAGWMLLVGCIWLHHYWNSKGSWMC